MGTSRSEGGFGVELVGGGPATPEQVAAVAAALEVVLGAPAAEPPPVSRWRWSGRRWGRGTPHGLDWRDPSPTAHPSRP